MISYGLPGDDNYTEYRDLDIENYGQSYNATLWRKEAVASGNTITGLSYILIASLSGTPTKITIANVQELDAGSPPDVEADETNPGEVILTFKLPQSQTFGNVQTIVASSNSLPEVSIDNTDINHPELIFKLPQAQALNVVASYTIQETADFTANLENGVSYIEEHYIGNVSSSDLFAITWVLLDGSSVSYWYFQDMTQIWSRIQVSGAAGNIIENIYNNEAGGPDNKAYSINYTNKLINDNLITDNKAIKTYSARLLEDLLSWGTYEDLMQ